MPEKFETRDVGELTDDYFEADGPERASSILYDHPLFLTIRMDWTGYEGAPVSHGLGSRLLSPRKKLDSAIKGDGFKSTVFWPAPLLSKKARKKLVISGGRYMSKAFWPTPLLSKTPRRNKVIKGGDHPLSNALRWPTTS